MKKEIQLIVIFTIIGLITIVGVILRGGGGIRCDYDGTRIQPIYEVDLTFEDGSTKRFCSIVCVSMQLKDEKKKLKYITVVDEVSGNKIDASLAFFVESDVVTVHHVKNNIHVFAKEEYAKRHARQFTGKLIANFLF